MSHEAMSQREQMGIVIEKVQQIVASQDEPEISKVVGNIDTALYSNESPKGSLLGKKYDDVDVLPKQAKELLDALSKSGLETGTKLELSKMARKVWEGWKVNPLGIEFARKSNGDRRRFGKGGAAEVYLAHIKLRDENDNLDPMPVAVKQFVVNPAEQKDKFAEFIREVFLEKDAQHPCIVRTLGGHWPTPSEA